jgi:cytochrome c-type biogenesis protein CcmH
MATPLRFTLGSKAAKGVPTRGSLSFWLKGAQALALAVAVCFSLGASDSGARFSDLGHRLMCTCGCAQLLGECDHAGCPAREGENKELAAMIANGDSTDAIFAAFTTKYGATVLAAPTGKGFDIVAWIAPVAVFVAALLGTILLVRRWSGVSLTSEKAALKDGTAAADPANDQLREKIRRETGADGGF